MNYFAKKNACLAAKNKLQEAAYLALRNSDMVLVDNAVDFIKVLKATLADLEKKHPRCNPDCVKVRYTVYASEDVVVNVGPNFMGYTLYRVRGHMAPAQKTV